VEHFELRWIDCHLCRNSFLCTKFHQNRTIYHWDITILHYFQNDGCQLSWIFEILSITFVGMLFCILLLNFTEIGQLFDELCQKRFSQWRLSAILNFEKNCFWSCGCHRVHYLATDYSVPNLIKIGRFITDNAHFVMNLIVKKIKIGQYFSQCYERTSSGTFYGVLCSIHGICLLNPTKKYQGNKYLVASTSKSNKYSNSSKIALLRTACGRGQSYLALSLAS